MVQLRVYQYKGMNERYFKVNEPDASTEDFQTEILAVNLKSGHYHSLQGTAVPIWRLLMAGHGTQSVAILLAEKYPVDISKVRDAVDSLLTKLEKAELIVAAPPSGSSPELSPAWLSGLSGDFAEPRLESYTDMQDLLVLDPIHDVDMQGWPQTPQQGPG